MLPHKKIGFLWDILFCIVVVFNILHYFDLFHFNRLVMPIYCGADNKHLVYYGLNRIGLLAQRRMIGTVGNPNYNVIIFIFFAILYAPKPQWKLKNGIFFFLALAGIFACQSRTGLIAFALFYICHLIFTPLQWKTKIWQTVAVVGFFFILFLSNNLYYKAKIDNPNFEPYLETVLDGKAFSTNSWTARLDLWQMLIEKGSEHWFMGHSPDKQFFYEVEFDKRKIHADNEYVLFFYKYGSIGLLLYILLYILPSCRAVSKARNSVEARQMGFTAIAFATCAITNCPLSHPVTVLLFVYIIAQFYSVTPYYNLKKHVAERE
jgi:O-antigen ligase